ncbi:pre-toxin TG domain-containing protein [Acetivibrio clariflavus]|uniref:pre-toxin TG domain-containing protein n=1 Tax=Acetivibrio clariflavus TaxID=288965 RepID=UPI00211E973B|nr:pre-toxin TG domain-containing protein [Acetivibrio clariflavus]
MTVGFTPLDGIKDAADFIAGKDVVTGQKTNRIILGIMIFAPEAVDKGLRKYAKSGKNVAEESVERILKNNIQESSEAAVKRGIKNSAQESVEAAVKKGIKKSDKLVEASTGIRFINNIDDFGKIGIPELPKNEVQKNFLEVTRSANNVGSGVGNKSELQQIIDNLDLTKGGSLGNVDNWDYVNSSFQNKILNSVPNLEKFKDRTVAVIGHRDSIIPFQQTRRLNNKINVFKANKFGPGGWTAEKNLQWIKEVVENSEVVYFASQKLNSGFSWTREEIKYLLDCGYRQVGSYFLPPR